MTPEPFPPPRLDPVALLDGLLDPFFTVDAHWRCTYVNRHAAAIVGVTPAELQGRVLWDCFPEALETALDTEYRRVMGTRQSRQFDLYYPPLAVWVEVRAFPHADGIAVHFRDITERKRLEERREALLAVTRAVAAASTVAEAAASTLDCAVRVLGAQGGAIWRLMQGGRLELWEDSSAEAPSPVGIGPTAAQALDEPEGIFLRGSDLPAGPGPAFPRALAALPLGVGPLGVGEETLGVLALYFGSDRTFNGGERDFARSLAAGLAHALRRIGAAEANERPWTRPTCPASTRCSCRRPLPPFLSHGEKATGRP